MSGTNDRPRSLLWATAAAVCIAVPSAVLTFAPLRAQTASEAATPASDEIIVSADLSQEWHTAGDDIALLRGRCRIVQRATIYESDQIILWHSPIRLPNGELGAKLGIYLEGNVRLDGPNRAESSPATFFELRTQEGIRFDVARRLRNQPADSDPLFERGLTRRSLQNRSLTQRDGLQQTQFLVPDGAQPDGELRVVQLQPGGGSLRRVRIFPRSAVPYNVLSFRSTRTTPPEQVWVLSGGINLLIDGVEEYGTVDLAADRMVIWTQSEQTEEFRSETIQSRETPFTVYLEGNIVIRQSGGTISGLNDGETIVRATQAVYDAREDRGLLQNADLKKYIPALKDDIRLRADRLRQLSRNSFHAQRASITTSDFGKPGYRLQASDIYLEDRYVAPLFGPAGPIDPVTGAPAVEEVPWITSLNNAFLIEDFPLLYLPRLSGPAENPNVPLRRATVRNDNIFGAQLNTIWNMYQLLGIEEPRDTQWDLLLDYRSERGPAGGMATEYQGADLLGIPGTYFGEGLAYGMYDMGEDNLGRGRRSLEVEDDFRSRLLLRHRHNLPDFYTFTGEVGYLSDRNLLEQYYEREFDRNKDNETLGYLKQQFDNFAWSAIVRPQVNDFETTTEWLPRGDLYLLSEPLLNGAMTWSSHTSAAYGRLRPAAAPSDPNDLFDPLPYVSDADGAVLMTRHELAAPFQLGPLNIVPFAMGEAAFWSEDLTGDQLDRLVGRVGVRSSLMFWRTFPYVQSRLFNLNGLAHKVRLEAEYALTESTADLSQVAQYNEFDDNAQNRFRYRLLQNTFGGTLPPQFAPRFYAVRSGAGSSVTDPYHELIDDQQVVRLALRQRLQTKVGPPERLRIKDWMTLDLEASFFPNPDRDNFGEDVGLLGANYDWEIGDRTHILANALYDVFEGGQEMWNLGVVSQRSNRGSFYVGLRQIKGGDVLDSQTLVASYAYQMSDKWVSTVGTSHDLAEHRNNGQSLVVTRIGADFLVHFGVNYDASKDNAGIALAIEPKFGPFAGNPLSAIRSLTRSVAQ